MKQIPLPKKFIVEEIVKDKKAKVIIEPCFTGYGLTVGNALRRALLSSLAGGAVTAVKIAGVKHEFSSMSDVSEDVVEIILNLKKLRIKVNTEEPTTLKLYAKGESEVTGANVQATSDAEVINKDLHIATLNDSDAIIDMELTVQRGIGYVPVEEQGRSKGDIGLILVDALYSPVISVGLAVEETRVGKKTDYDKIILEIETDGTISPEAAVMKSAEILTSQFAWIMEGGRKEVEEVDIEAPVKLAEKPEVAPAVEAVEESTEETQPEESKKKRGRPKKNDE
ncbi:MAG: DNA-directed RNA polymerase subunit alpha [bacterium]